MEITEKDILSFNFYKYKQPFTGSCKGMRYRIVRQEKKPEIPDVGADGAGTSETAEEPELVFRVSVWREPYAYDCTPEDEIENQDFIFDQNGYEQVLAWLNQKVEEYKGK